MGFFQNTQKPAGLGGRIMLNLMNKGHSKMAKWGFSHINIKKDDIVLDVGCGGGANIATWLKGAKEGKVFGIDYSKESVKKSSKVNSHSIKNGRCEILEANVMELPFKDGKFTKVSAFETIYFWPDIEKSFSEVYRVLKSNGQFIICNEIALLDKSSEKWTKIIDKMKIYEAEEIKEKLEKVGFSNIEINRNRKNWLCILANKN